MATAWLRAILILPGNVLVTIPALLLYFTGYEWPGGDRLPQTIGGAALILAGLWLAAWTMLLFALVGQGTPAPWNPPKRLVVSGPYRHVRNPMITSVLAMLGGEALLAGSAAIAIWLGVFFLINVVYFKLVEEKKLEQRFGGEYTEYRRNVPRWLPRLSAWTPPVPWERP